MESSFSQLTHGVSLVTTITILGILLKEHSVWVKLKGRVNDMYADYCKAHGTRYSKVEDNGHD